MESHGQRRRCRRGLLRGHAGAWWHGMRGGGGCGPWGMRGGGGRFGCSARGRGFGVEPVGRPGQPSAAAAAAGTAEQPPVSTDNSAHRLLTVMMDRLMLRPVRWQVRRLHRRPSMAGHC